MSSESRRAKFRQWAGHEETHISAVYLIGDKVLKIKKPVRNDFLDFTTVEARSHACHEEVRLNRRLSPDIYLGVATIDLGDAAPEPAVVMRRLDDDDRLASHVGGDPSRLRTDVEAVARTVATFHARSSAVTDETSPGTWQQQVARWRAEWSALAALDPSLSADHPRSATLHLGLRYLSGRKTLFDTRVRLGKVRDVHGDLRADHVYLTADGVRIVDCLEFDPALRTCDILADVAFLAMDLERLGERDAADHFLAVHRELTDDVYPPSLADFYIAQRALVRLKVALLLPGARSRSDLSRQDDLLHLAERHLEAAQPHLTCIGGLPGSGKSTIGTALAARSNAVYLSSDAIRHERAGGIDLTTESAWGSGRYTAAETEAVYAELRHRAEAALANGYSVVLDASWRDTGHRDEARQAADRAGAVFSEILCEVDERTAYKRVRGTRSGFSEAGVSVRRHMRDAFDPWPTAGVVSTEGDLSASLDAAESLVKVSGS